MVTLILQYIVFYRLHVNQFGCCGLLLLDLCFPPPNTCMNSLSHVVLVFIFNCLNECGLYYESLIFVFFLTLSLSGNTSDYSQERWSFARRNICGRRKAHFWAATTSEWQWALWMYGQKQIRIWKNRIYDDNIRWVNAALPLIYCMPY